MTRPGAHGCPSGHSTGYFHQSGRRTSIRRLEHAYYPNAQSRADSSCCSRCHADNRGACLAQAVPPSHVAHGRVRRPTVGIPPRAVLVLPKRKGKHPQKVVADPEMMIAGIAQDCHIHPARSRERDIAAARDAPALPPLGSVPSRPPAQERLLSRKAPLSEFGSLEGQTDAQGRDSLIDKLPGTSRLGVACSYQPSPMYGSCTVSIQALAI
jgi:hypothetical protein